MNFLCRPHVLHLRYNDYSDAFKKISLKVPIVLWTVNEIGLFEKLKNEIHGIISDEIIPAEIKS